MSNLTNLMQNGTIEVAESVEYESITENQMSQIMQVAMEDLAVDEMMESVSVDSEALFEGVLPEDAVVMERTIVKMDKQAKKQRAYKLAILQSAKDAGDKAYKQLETVWKMEKFLMRKLEKKYAQKARSRMKQTAKKSSNKGMGTKLKNYLGGGKKMTRSQRETQKAMSGNNKVPAGLKSQFGSISSKIGNKIK